MSGCCACETNSCYQKYPSVIIMTCYLFFKYFFYYFHSRWCFSPLWEGVELTVQHTSYLLLPRYPLFSPIPSSHHVCIHEEPATAPALSGYCLTKTHLQKPVCQTEGWRVVCWQGCRRAQTPQQVCRSRKAIRNLGQLMSNAFLSPDWLAF